MSQEATKPGFSFYRQHRAQRKRRQRSYSEADFEFFFAPQGRHVAPMGMKFGTEWTEKILLVYQWHRNSSPA